MTGSFDDSGSVTLHGNLSIGGSVALGGHLRASSVGTAPSDTAGVTITDVPLFLITNGSVGTDFLLALPSSPSTGDMIVIINKDPIGQGLYPSTSAPTIIVPALGSRTIYYDGTAWQ